MQKIKIFLVLSAIALLFSCYSQKVILNGDRKSGQVIVEYNLDDDYFQLFSIAVENFNSMNAQNQPKFDPGMLLDANMLRDYFKDNKYIKITSVNIDTSKGYKGKVVATFSDFEKLLDSIPKGVTNLSLKKDQETITLTQSLNLKEMDPEGVFKNYIMKQKEDDINYYNKLTKETKFSFYLITTTPIKKVEGVFLSSDKKNASYTFKLNDLFINEEKPLKFLISL
jgi:hypothetical protein